MGSDEEVAIIPAHAAYRDDLAVFIRRRVQVCRVRQNTPCRTSRTGSQGQRRRERCGKREKERSDRTA